MTPDLGVTHDQDSFDKLWIPGGLSGLQKEREPKLSAQLRPKGFDEFIGQTHAVRILHAMTSRGTLSDSVLFVGGPGLGKTTLAFLTSDDVTVQIGSNLTTSDDAKSVFNRIKKGDVLFVDEIHSAKRKSLELFYTAMEDGYYAGDYGREELPDFQVVGATTELGKVPRPLRERFGQIIFLEYYTNEEIAQILFRSKDILELEMSEGHRDDVAVRSRGVPRIANRLMRRIKDFAIDSIVSSDLLEEMWDVLSVDSLGLERVDRAALEFLATKTRPVGVRALSQAIGLDSAGMEDAVEPYLLRLGLMEVGPGGRTITTKGLLHVANSSS